MTEEVKHIPTGLSRKWGGLDFDQYQIVGDIRGFEAIFKVRGHEHLTIEYRGGHNYAAVNGKRLLGPNGRDKKFRTEDTAARALKEHIGAEPK